MKSVKEEVLKFIKIHDQTSYVELEELFEQIGFNYRGKYAVGAVSAESHLITWSGWNAEAFNILSELLAEKLIEQVSVHPVIYFLDGEGLTLPVAKTAKNYKKPHWLPVAFNACKKGAVENE